MSAKRPRFRVEGGSLSCWHCNRTFTFNVMRDGSDFTCECPGARAERAESARTSGEAK